MPHDKPPGDRFTALEESINGCLLKDLRGKPNGDTEDLLQFATRGAFCNARVGSDTGFGSPCKAFERSAPRGRQRPTCARRIGVDRGSLLASYQEGVWAIPPDAFSMKPGFAHGSEVFVGWKVGVLRRPLVKVLVGALFVDAAGNQVGGP